MDVNPSISGMYTVFFTAESSENESTAFDIPELEITDFNSATDLTATEINLSVKLRKPNQPVGGNKLGADIEICQLNALRSCDVVSITFSRGFQGVYEFSTPNAPFELKIKLRDTRASAEWTAVSRNNRQRQSLRIKLWEPENHLQIELGQRAHTTQAITSASPVINHQQLFD